MEISRYRVDPDFLMNFGTPIPILVHDAIGVAMVDNGARISVIDIAFAHRLGLEEHGKHEIAGTTATGLYPTFNAEIQVPWLETSVPSPIGGAPLRENRLPWHALIGRDIINQFELRINGPTGLVQFLTENTERP